ncbi:MAG: 50S ribosomal protein L1 [Candidatus Omnitrophica bacterium]|nr:50S ribosomal protein L1 [Candidatus Omnitrophota bacterium]MBU4488814.1 50S ribosomal protein L1 [Candidatus Omnitrophota bacterium]MCG2705525.1 50S ribosomal protein L1 [Candidatus Omnitrophota bacterium]
MALSKRKKEFEKSVDPKKTCTLREAIEVLKKAPKTKFDQTVEVSFRININVKETSLSVRGTVSLPHGTGKTRKVAVFCKGEDDRKAKAAGADFVGADDLVKKVSEGWCDFDVAIATPEMMKDMGRLGKILGPRGLMPNPKAGTVTQDVEKAVQDVKKGKIEFKMDKQSNIHAMIGKLSFETNLLVENGIELIEAVERAKPPVTKGVFIKSLSVSSTMGPGLRLDYNGWRG